MALVTLPTRFLPDKGLTWISWAYPRYAYPGLSVDFKMTGYDWYNRQIRWSLVNTPTTVNPATINKITGIMDWIPDFTENFSDFEFTVRMTLDGAETVDYTFTTTVDLTRFIFCDWNLGVDENTDPLRGSEFAPYQSVRYAQSERAVDGQGAVFMIRGGTSNESYVYTTNFGTDTPTGAFTLNTADTPILTRNYPGETVINDCQGLGGSYVANCPFSIIYNLTANNIGSSGIGMCVTSDAMGILLSANNNDQVGGVNPSGVRYQAGSVLHSCDCADNYDRAAGNNSQDYIGFLTSGTGDAYLIDCISRGPNSGTIKQTCGMRTKGPADWDATTAQGEYKTLFHRCVVTNPLSSGFSAIHLNAGDSFRCGVVVFDGAPYRSTAGNLESGRPANNTITQSLYYVSQDNLWCSDGVVNFSTICTNTNRCLIYDDDYFTETGFNPFKIDLPSSGLSPTYAGFDFQQNTFYAPAESDIFATIEGTGYLYAEFNVPSTGETDPVGGTGNVVTAIPASVSKEAAGKNWSWDGATLTESEIVTTQFNFRQTLAYVTDDPGQIAVVQFTNYPTVNGDLTYGWTVPAPTSQYRNRTATNPPELAGSNLINNTNGTMIFATNSGDGEFNIRLAAGDGLFAGTQFVAIVEIDGSQNEVSVLATVADNVAKAGNEWIDAGGTIRTSTTDWETNNEQITVTVSSGNHLGVRLGDPAATAGSASSLAHFSYESVASPDNGAYVKPIVKTNYVNPIVRSIINGQFFNGGFNSANQHRNKQAICVCL